MKWWVCVRCLRDYAPSYTGLAQAPELRCNVITCSLCMRMTFFIYCAWLLHHVTVWTGSVSFKSLIHYVWHKRRQWGKRTPHFTVGGYCWGSKEPPSVKSYDLWFYVSMILQLEATIGAPRRQSILVSHKKHQSSQFTVSCWVFLLTERLHSFEGSDDLA